MEKENVLFVPQFKLGRDVSFEDLTKEWGFSAVILANGSWRDRSLRIDDIDQYIGKGLLYQNPFVYWFNHYFEKNYNGPQYEIPDGAIVIGGGLASIDVIKIIQLELAMKKLKEKGIDAKLHDLELKGIPKILENHNLKWEDLGLKGGTLFYRRRKKDMPLMSTPDNATEKQIAKAENVRERILDNAMRKYCFNYQDCSVPTKAVIENDCCVGIEFVRTEVKEGRKSMPEVIEGSEKVVKTGLVVSSIGSVPERIEGIPTKGDFYCYADWDTGKMEGCEGVYGSGNVVTGQGNIIVSRKHSQFVTNYIIENELNKKTPVDKEKILTILGRIKEHLQKINYNSFNEWIKKVAPKDEG